MTEADPSRPMAALLGFDRGVVSLVGAGGKTTLAHSLVAEAQAAGLRGIVTTTTKMGADQEDGLRLVTGGIDDVASAVEAAGACLVVAEATADKLVGVRPEFIDRLAAADVADVIAVEADGARRRLIKAPASHEPVVPASSSLVVAVMSATAFDRPIATHAHRPEVVADLAGVGLDESLTAEMAAKVLTSRRGGRKGVPEQSEFVIAVTRSSHAPEAVDRLRALVAPVPLAVIG